ncbi:MAG: hypothetical protein AAF439_11395 [Pseudomonadota bacterium]
MRKLLLLFAVPAIALLAGCAEPQLPLADVAVIKAVDGSTDGMDIYAARRNAGESVPNQRGNQIVEVRTYLPKTDDFGQEVPGQEISGALCEAILDNHRATVRTPGGIHVPLYGYVTAPFSVTCNMDGFQKSVGIFKPFNKTISDRRAATASAGASGGLLGAVIAVVIVEGINAASDETNDEFIYGTAPILMRPGTTSADTVVAATETEPATTTEAANATTAVATTTANDQPTTTTLAAAPAQAPRQAAPKPALAADENLDGLWVADANGGSIEAEVSGDSIRVSLHVTGAWTGNYLVGSGRIGSGGNIGTIRLLGGSGTNAVTGKFPQLNYFGTGSSGSIEFELRRK